MCQHACMIHNKGPEQWLMHAMWWARTLEMTKVLRQWFKMNYISITYAMRNYIHSTDTQYALQIHIDSCIYRSQWLNILIIFYMLPAGPQRHEHKLFIVTFRSKCWRLHAYQENRIIWLNFIACIGRQLVLLVLRLEYRVLLHFLNKILIEKYS